MGVDPDMVSLTADRLGFTMRLKAQTHRQKRWPNGTFTGSYWDVNANESHIAMGQLLPSYLPRK